MDSGECLLCQVEKADALFERRRVWQDEHWRLSVVLRGPVAGFAHLESRRHIPAITDLDGPEAASMGPALAFATRCLREATGAERVYVYVFGDRVPHLHFNLAPHRSGDALAGGAALTRADAEPVESSAHRAAADAIERRVTQHAWASGASSATATWK